MNLINGTEITICLSYYSELIVCIYFFSSLLEEIEALKAIFMSELQLTYTARYSFLLLCHVHQN